MQSLRCEAKLLDFIARVDCLTLKFCHMNNFNFKQGDFFCWKYQEINIVESQKSLLGWKVVLFPRVFISFNYCVLLSSIRMIKNDIFLLEIVKKVLTFRSFKTQSVFNEFIFQIILDWYSIRTKKSYVRPWQKGLYCRF